MKLHELKNTPGSRRRAKRVGRGESSGWGKTSGRGNKGQHSRAGSGHRVMFEGGQMPLMRRLPKRGFKPPTRVVYSVVNVGDLESFDAGTTVDIAALRSRRLVRGSAGNPVKILGFGSLSRNLTVRVHACSASAKQKIEAAGGGCELLK
ncbi:MAG: 50S ribosomal protein L15 [Kiritimatiellae bacterium]|nr:50S ribosomal protein L15 [Kiritimatiellia bacterium]